MSLSSGPPAPLVKSAPLCSMVPRVSMKRTPNADDPRGDDPNLLSLSGSLSKCESEEALRAQGGGGEKIVEEDG